MEVKLFFDHNELTSVLGCNENKKSVIKKYKCGIKRGKRYFCFIWK